MPGINLLFFQSIYLQRSSTSARVCFLSPAFLCWRRTSPGQVRPTIRLVACGYRISGSKCTRIHTRYFLATSSYSSRCRLSKSFSLSCGICPFNLKTNARPSDFERSALSASPCRTKASPKANLAFSSAARSAYSFF